MKEILCASDEAVKLVDEFGTDSILCGTADSGEYDIRRQHISRKRLLNFIASIEGKNKKLLEDKNGYDIDEKQPRSGERVVVLMSDGKKCFDYLYSPVFERSKIPGDQHVIRWWSAPKTGRKSY